MHWVSQLHHKVGPVIWWHNGALRNLNSAHISASATAFLHYTVSPYFVTKLLSTLTMQRCSSRRFIPIMKSSVMGPTATSILDCLPCILIGSCPIMRQRTYEPCYAFLTRMCSRDTVTVGLSKCINDRLVIDISAAISTSNNVSTA